MKKMDVSLIWFCRWRARRATGTSSRGAASAQPTRSAIAVGFLVFISCAFTTAQGREVRWASVATGRELSLSIHEPPSKTANAVPVVFYLQNLAAPRVGRESDDAIIDNFLAGGYLVVAVDYSGDAKARVPFINRDLGKLRDDVRRGRLLAEHKVDAAHVFIVPAGSRLKRDVVFYRDGERALAMDIIYPSKSARPVGAVLEFSCDNQDRMGNTSLTSCSDTILDAEATEGFAVAMADHPVAAPYHGFDAMPESAWKIKAAVRTLRSIGSEVGLSGRIVPVGFSRGSGMALMLVTTVDVAELDGHGENPRENSRVQGAVVMSGRFTYVDLLPKDKMVPRYTKAWGERDAAIETWRRHGALDYLQAVPNEPLFLTINCTEGPDAMHQMKVLRNRLATLGADEVFLMDREPRGHKVTLDPDILRAMNRYIHERLEKSTGE